MNDQVQQDQLSTVTYAAYVVQLLDSEEKKLENEAEIFAERYLNHEDFEYVLRDDVHNVIIEGTERKGLYIVKAPVESREQIPSNRDYYDSANHLKASLEQNYAVDYVDPDIAFRPLSIDMADFKACGVPRESDPGFQEPPDHGWALRSMHVAEAFVAHPDVRGRGVVIGHLDTGYLKHKELDEKNFRKFGGAKKIGKSVINRETDATDIFEEILDYVPGHGTLTASLIVSPGELVPYNGAKMADPQRDKNEGIKDAGDMVVGIAPQAEMLSIRCLRGVFAVHASRVVKAIHMAIDEKVDIITMSLGGLPTKGTFAAIREAVAHDIIVVAAAGNCVQAVVYPAGYPQCIGVGGTNIHDKPWRGSSHGQQVNIAAPGEQVWGAKCVKGQGGKPPPSPQLESAAGWGTSFSTATMAGIAALWLDLIRHELSAQQQNDFDALRALGFPMQAIFATQLEKTARKPPSWDGNYGAGIVDALALLNDPIPSANEIEDWMEARDYNKPWGQVWPDLARETIDLIGFPQAGFAPLSLVADDTEPDEWYEENGEELMSHLIEYAAVQRIPEDRDAGVKQIAPELEIPDDEIVLENYLGAVLSEKAYMQTDLQAYRIEKKG